MKTMNANPIVSRVMNIHTVTDDDFSIDGQGFYDGGYRGSLSMQEGESLKECYNRWLESVTVEGYKAEDAKVWLRDEIRYGYSDDETLCIPGGNWELECWVTTERKHEPKIQSTLYIEWCSLPEHLREQFQERYTNWGLFCSDSSHTLDVHSGSFAKMRANYEQWEREGRLRGTWDDWLEDNFDVWFVQQYIEAMHFENAVFNQVVVEVSW